MVLDVDDDDNSTICTAKGMHKEKAPQTRSVDAKLRSSVGVLDLVDRRNRRRRERHIYAIVAHTRCAYHTYSQTHTYMLNVSHITRTDWFFLLRISCFEIYISIYAVRVYMLRLDTRAGCLFSDQQPAFRWCCSHMWILCIRRDSGSSF